MNKLNLQQKIAVQAQGFAATRIYPWNTALYAGLVGQALNGFLALINQMVYNNNTHPKYHTATAYDDHSTRLYIRAGHNAMSSTMSIGSPFI
ncbi:hypothetical protein [Ureaplasma ceti]|uniref:Transketolase n=1 Tax=Ureaplasma ceti TaxID=3119530 RepID=A0ABP9U500_9BACT